MNESTSHLIRFLQQENTRLKEDSDRLHEENQGLVNYLRLLEDLYRAAQEIGSRDDLLEILDDTLNHAMWLAKANDGSVMLLDKESHELVFAVVHGDKRVELRGYRIAADTGIAGWVAAQKKPVIANNPHQDWRFSPQVDEAFAFETRSLVCVPMLAGETMVGVIEVLNKLDNGNFNEADVNLLLILGNVAATAMQAQDKKPSSGDQPATV